MSQLEVAQNSSPLYSVTLPAMVAGTTASTNVVANYPSIANYFGACSKIVGIVRTTTGAGAVGTKYYASYTVGANSTATGFVPVIQLRSDVNTDDSTYTIYWCNEVASSGNQTVLSC